MSKINLETEPCFKELMKQIGFKKTKGKFVRNEEETIWGLSFGHGSYGQRQVRYYDCLYSVDYPQITEAAKQLGEYVYGHYGQIGYLMPEKRFVEWRLADSDTEEYYLNMINNIKEALEKYVIPFMEKYSTMNTFVNGVESENIREPFDQKAVAIAYVLLGRKDDALRYMDEVIEKEKHKDFFGKGVETEVTKEYRMETSYPKENKYLKDYMNFVQKLKLWMTQPLLI